MENLGRFINFLENLNLTESLIPTNLNLNVNETGRSYPLVNHTALFQLKPIDIIRPGVFDAQLSTLPLFQVLLNVGAFIIWLIVFLYAWKLIYYEVSDPYATPNGDAPPHYKREIGDNMWETVYNALDRFSNYFSD